MVKTNSANTATSNMAFPFGSPEAFNGVLSEALGRNRAIVENMMKTLNGEAMRFIGKRFEHTGQAIEECQDCKSLPEFFTVQQKWASGAVREYMEEGLRVGETMQKLLADFASVEAQPPKKESAFRSASKEFAGEASRVHA
jgi:hypothetical protein